MGLKQLLLVKYWLILAKINLIISFKIWQIKTAVIVYGVS